LELTESIRRRLRILGVGIAVAILTGVAGYCLIEGWSVFDALYMTVITITTVGYLEVHPMSAAGRTFTMFLLLFGVVILFFGIGLITQIALDLELSHYFGKRRVRQMIEKLENHYIVCGFGRVGRGAADELRSAKIPFVVVDRNEDRVTQALKLGDLAVLADANRDETLRDVGIARARGLIATLATDADNLFLILSARSLNPKLQLAARVAEEEAEAKMRLAGATHVFAPYTLTGHRMAQSLVKPHVQQFLEFTTRSMGLAVGIEQVAVSEKCRWAGQSLAQIQLRRDTGVIVLAIRKGDGTMLFNPPADAQIRPGDYLIAMGEPEGLQRLETILAEHHS
jgi:voltage-gated potassium channel